MQLSSVKFLLESWWRQALPILVVLLALYAVQVFFFYQQTPYTVSAGRAVAIASQDFLVWALILPLVFHVQARITELRRPAVHLLAAPIFAAGHITTDSAINLLTAQVSPGVIGEVLKGSMAGMIFINVLVYLLILLAASVLEQRSRPVSSSPQTALLLRDGRELRRIPFEEILWIESANNHVGVHAVDGSRVFRDTLARLETLLPDHFVRVHRSALVNINAVRRHVSKTHGDGCLELKDGSKVRTSRRYRDAIEAALPASR